MRFFVKKIILIACLILPLSACEVFVQPMPKSWNWGMTPRPLTGVRGFPPADTAYGQGFKDGCGAAWDAIAKGLLGDFNHGTIDPKRLVNDGDYATGWEDGIEHCTYIMDWETT